MSRKKKNNKKNRTSKQYLTRFESFQIFVFVNQLRLSCSTIPNDIINIKINNSVRYFRF